MYPASSKTHTHSNRFLLGWYVWSLYKVGFSIPRTFTLRNILPTLSFCAKPKAKTQNPSSNKLPSPLKRVATVADVVLGRGRAFSHTPHPHKREPTPEEKFSFAREFNCQVQQMNDPRRIPESVFSFFHIRVKVYLLSELKEYEKYRTI